MVAVPSVSTVHRILRRHGLIARRGRRRDATTCAGNAPNRCSYGSSTSSAGSCFTDGTEAKIVTGLDNCSRFCVIATVVARATGRAVCLAFAAAIRRYGIPDEVLTAKEDEPFR